MSTVTFTRLEDCKILGTMYISRLLVFSASAMRRADKNDKFRFSQATLAA